MARVPQSRIDGLRRLHDARLPHRADLYTLSPVRTTGGVTSYMPAALAYDVPCKVQPPATVQIADIADRREDAAEWTVDFSVDGAPPDLGLVKRLVARGMSGPEPWEHALEVLGESPHRAHQIRRRLRCRVLAPPKPTP